MANVRFSKVVQSAGQPDIHLLWMDPTKDTVLKKAIKAHRVVTLHQATTGTQTDYGTVGFQKGVSGQILIFPKSVKAFEGKRIVGVKYELLGSKPIPKSQQAGRPKPPPKKKTPKPRPSGVRPKPERSPSEPERSKVVPFPGQELPAPKKETSARQIKSQVRKAMKALEAGKQVVAFNLLKKIVDS